MASGGKEVAVDETSLANFLNRVAVKLDEQAREGSGREVESTQTPTTSGANIIEFDMDDLEIDFGSKDSTAVSSVQQSEPLGTNDSATGGPSDSTESRATSDATQSRANQGENIEDLLLSLMGNIRSSGWLDNNTVPKWNKENPELVEEYVKRAKNPKEGDETL